MIDHKHVYANFTISNLDDFNFNFPAEYDESLTNPIIDKANDYEMSVESFSIPGQNIPLLIFRIVEGLAQANRDLGVYSVTLTHVPSGTNFTENVIYVPTMNIVPLPNPPSLNGGVQDFNSIYYYVYSYQNMLDMINTAFNDAFLAYNAAFPGVISGPPYFIYNYDLGRFSLVVPEDYVTANNVEVWINTPMQNLFTSFNYFFDPSSIIGKNFMFLLEAFTNNENGYWPPGVAVALPPPYFKFDDEFNLSEYWCSIEKIIITTNTIPIIKEYIQTNNTNAGQSVSFGILSSFSPTINNSGDARRTFIYDNQSDYRWITLTNSLPLGHMQFKFYYLTCEQLLVPIIISPRNSVHVKLAFRKNKINMYI